MVEAASSIGIFFIITHKRLTIKIEKISGDRSQNVKVKKSKIRGFVGSAAKNLIFAQISFLNS